MFSLQVPLSQILPALSHFPTHPTLSLLFLSLYRKQIAKQTNSTEKKLKTKKKHKKRTHTKPIKSQNRKL